LLLVQERKRAVWNSRKSRYCPGKLVTLKEREALVQQGN
jgi:hypothetical protein